MDPTASSTARNDGVATLDHWLNHVTFPKHRSASRMVTGPGPAGLDERNRRAERPRVRPRLSRKGRTGNHGRVTETPETSSTPTQVPGARPPWSFLMDMDGVLVHEEHIIPGADEFIAELTARGANFVVVTNNPIYTRRDLRARLLASGLDIPEDRIWTSALATAKFLDSQRPGGSAFVIGEVGLTTAMHEAGYVLTDRNPDYVVLGETRTYSFEAITTAIRLIEAGARFVGTNPDPTGPSRAGLLPCGRRRRGVDREGDQASSPTSSASRTR